MDWVAVEVGHMIEVQEGQRIFLKDQSIRKCVGFQKYLDVPSHSAKPHLRFNLPGERAYVHEMLKAGSPVPSPERTPPPLSPQLLPQTTTLFSHADIPDRVHGAQHPFLPHVISWKKWTENLGFPKVVIYQISLIRLILHLRSPCPHCSINHRRQIEHL